MPLHRHTPGFFGWYELLAGNVEARYLSSKCCAVYICDICARVKGLVSIRPEIRGVLELDGRIRPVGDRPWCFRKGIANMAFFEIICTSTANLREVRLSCRIYNLLERATTLLQRWNLECLCLDSEFVVIRGGYNSRSHFQTVVSKSKDVGLTVSICDGDFNVP
jgi:hypothetical protein